MRMLNRNAQTVWYATVLNKNEIIDEHGCNTGAWEITYSQPVKAKWNVGYVTADAEVEMFGILAKDSLRIVAPKQGFPLTEESILWFGKEPEDVFDPTSPKHNYAIAGICPGLNHVVFYARKVEVS